MANWKENGNNVFIQEDPEFEKISDKYIQDGNVERIY